MLYIFVDNQSLRTGIYVNILLQVLLYPGVLLADKQGLHLRADRQGGSDQTDQKGARLVAKTPLRTKEAPLAES